MFKVGPWPCTSFLIVLCFLQSHAVEIGGGVSSVVDLDSAKRVCSGQIGGCSEAKLEEEISEMVMDSESSRRVLLMQKRYISYDTLQRDLVPCDRPGASYYNCRGSGVANFYTRGCEVITRCRGD